MFWGLVDVCVVVCVWVCVWVVDVWLGAVVGVGVVGAMVVVVVGVWGVVAVVVVFYAQGKDKQQQGE